MVRHYKRKDVTAVHNLIWRPRCFDENDWQEWREAALNMGQREHIKSLIVSVCADCMPWYQTKMIEEGRCGNTRSKRT